VNNHLSGHHWHQRVFPFLQWFDGYSLSYLQNDLIAGTTTTNDTTTATTVYPNWVAATSGNNPNKVSSTKLTFVPSTGTLSATVFSGSGASLTTLNASNLSSGTVPDARITGSYTGMTNLTGSGTVDFAKFLGNAADTAAAPSFSWTGDTNTGIYTPGADQIGIATGGVSRFTVSTTAIASTLPISASTFTGALSGNATTATTLQTARTINGVSFNGSANITVESYIEDDEGTNATRYLTFVDNTTAAYKRLNEDSSLTYNPSTNTLVTGVVSANTFTEGVYTLGTTGSLTLSPANGTIQSSTLTGNPTFVDSLSSGQSIVLMLNNGASYTVTWPTITWYTSGGNAAPTLTAKDTLVFWKVSTTLYGAYVGSGA